MSNLVYFSCSGHTQKISIPGCVEFEITTNACRGYCVSYSIPSSEDTLRVNKKQLITSIGQCCSMIESEEVWRSVSSIAICLPFAGLSLPSVPAAGATRPD